MQDPVTVSSRLVCRGFLIAAAMCAGSHQVTAADAPELPGAIDFERDIHPILSARCLKCHGPHEPEAGLDLTRRDTAVEMGAIRPGDPEASTLLERIASPDASVRMPPQGAPLTPEQILLLRRWVAAGADWPRHWAYRSVSRPQLPEVRSAALRDWCRSPIDVFIAARLEEEGLYPSPEADRLTLLRRAAFDLWGLPPTPAEVDAFLQDESAQAWSSCIDRLLASPRYGERWARHWMDTVHFAETHGHDQDRPREHAWPYRDYLIQSFNADKPYETFVAEQVAGDILDPMDPEAIAATGFLAAGPWDESSLRDIREDSLDREIGRNLDRDDIVTTVMSTFASTSIHCARCHDHKFDPLTQEQYYGLQAVFAGIDKANRAYDRDPLVAAKRTELSERRVQLQQTFADQPATLLTADTEAALAAWELQQAVVWRPLQVETCVSRGGAVLTGLDDASVLASGPRPDKDVYIVDGHVSLPRLTALRLEVLTDESLPKQGPGRQDNGNLHLNEFRAFQRLSVDQPLTRELQCVSPLADFNQQGWDVAAAVDGNPNTAWGIFPAVSQAHWAVFPVAAESTEEAGIALHIELQQIHGGGHLIGRFRLSATDADPARLHAAAEIPFNVAQILIVAPARRSLEQRTQLAYWYGDREIAAELAALPAQQLVYAGTNRFTAEGSFRPALVPRTIHILHRGMVTEPVAEAVPAALSCLEGLPGTLAIAHPENEGDRRRALARWLADSRNSLVWRSIANRVWQWHFGRGLVDTPNDFGQLGSSPTHPQLLDWLAATLQERGGSLKELHRLIMTSAVYRQASNDRAAASAQDAENRWLWRMNRQRLDAESFHDALLVASGTLDETRGGPSVRQFLQSPGIHVTPEVDYQNFDVNDPANYRRSVYRFLFRTIPDPFMEALDCPDASQLTPRRNVSLTAIQALATLHDKFVVRQSELLAERLQHDEPDPAGQVALAYRRLFGRSPAEAELQAVLQYAERHGLANACRFLFNTNEFLFVD